MAALGLLRRRRNPLNIERRTKRKSLRRGGDHRSPRANEEEEPAASAIDRNCEGV
jgi:hypothetical protein